MLKRTHTRLADTFNLIAIIVVVGNLSNAQFTREEGEISVNGGDNEFFFQPHDLSGNDCTLASMGIGKTASKFYDTHPDSFAFSIMFTDFDNLIVPKVNCKNDIDIAEDSRIYNIQVVGENGLNRAWYGNTELVESFTYMNNVNFWIGRANPMSILVKDAGHRWMAYVSSNIINLELGALRGSAALSEKLNNPRSFFLYFPNISSSSQNSEVFSIGGNFWQDSGDNHFQTATAINESSAMKLYPAGVLPVNTN